MHGFLRPVSWTHFFGPTTDDDVDSYVDHHLDQARVAKAEGRKVVGLMLHYKASAPNAQQRHKIAKAIKESGELMGESLPLFAYVFDSGLTRGAVTAVSWLVKKPFAERIYRTPEEALQALESEWPGLDADALWRDIEAKVPEDKRFPRR